MIEIRRQPNHGSGGGQRNRMKQRKATAWLPWESLASRGSLAVHRPLFIGARGQMLNPQSVQILLDSC